MAIISPHRLAAEVRHAALPLRGERGDYDALLERIGDARFVLLGEASHGTHEFYRERARLTRRLILEKGFTAVAVEADWPDAYRVNRYVRGGGADRTSEEALGGFRRFPTWMWRNADVLELLGWLRAHNDALEPGAPKVGFYGLDLYSLHTSMAAVLSYLDQVDPEAAGRARLRYACFDHFGEDTQAYGYAATLGLSESCEQEAVRQLVELRRLGPRVAEEDGPLAEEEHFVAEQNARLVKNAEEYYRTMFGGRSASWNLRDRHMAETLDQLVAFLGERQGPAKVVVWAHNSHLGDARATEVAEHGQLNLGQLVRQAHEKEAFLLGFSTYEGTVTAASNWDAPAERKRVRPGRPDSYEGLFHAVGLPRFLLLLDEGERLAGLQRPRLQRAIGVIYRPETERLSHYFHARLTEQFDAMIHLDETRAVEPLERTPAWSSAEAPETFPSAL